MQFRAYTIVVDYGGASDLYYASASNNETVVTASLWTPTVTVTANNTKKGETAIITVKVTSDCPYEDIVSGNVSLYINGTNTKQFALVNGEYTFNVDDLAVGSWNAIVTYWGNTYHAESAGNVLFEVNKWNSDVNVTAQSINVGDIAYVYITVSGNYSDVQAEM